jgi:hypothetical protein
VLEQLFGAIPSLRKQLAARHSVWLSFHRPSMRANAAVKSVYHGRKGSATMLLGGSSPPCEKEKAGTAHEQLGRGCLAAWDLELGGLRTTTTAAGRVGLRLFGIPGQSGGRSNRSFMRWHGNCCGGCGRCGGGGDVGEACRSHRDSGTAHRPPPRRMVARIR